MKRVLLSLALAIAPASLFATQYTFTDSTTALEALSHGTAYVWGLDTSVLNSLHSTLTSGQHITSISITFTNVWDWTTEPGDILYVDALNGIPANTITPVVYNTNPATYDTTQGPDYFATTSATHFNYTTGESDIGLVGSWSDPHGGTNAYNNNITLSLSAAEVATFGTDLTADYAASGGITSHDIGFGLSPDCHYYDSGICVTITTAPNGAADRGLTLAMLGLAFLGLGYVARRSSLIASSAV